MTKESYKYGKRVTASSRSLALEQAYVHDVYSVIAINTSSCSPVRSHVKEFLFEEFEMGSILLDVGCSDGKYLNLKSDIVIIGLERCCEWFFNDLIKYKTTYCGDKQLITGDVMYLPFRDDLFDGVLCCGVLHHVSTAERRIRALREISRILKIGGKLLLTVMSGPVLGRELQSQDVLIKLDKFQHQINTSINTDETESDSSSSSYSHSNYVNTIYESCNSPNSEFGSCYTFMRKALQRFSFTGSLHSRRTSLNKSRTSTSSSQSKEDFPIELRNIEEDESISTAIDSPMESVVNLENKSVANSNTSHSNLINGSSLLSIIKEHIISFQLQFKSKHNINNESKKRNGFLQRKLSQHRFSLPINFKRSDNSNANLDTINRNNRIDLQQFTTKLHSDQNQSVLEIKKDFNEKEDNVIKKKEGFVKILQKSFSSDSLESRQASLDATGTRLVAYYSMPELYTLNESGAYETTSKSNRTLKNKPKLLELHPITFLIKNNNQTENKPIPESSSQNYAQNKNSNIITSCENSKNVEPIEENETEILLEREEMNDKLNSESNTQTQCNKFPKKLLRQRSFSADYQPEVPKAQNEQPRRFSASPNIGATRVNQIGHHQQISIDSEESFVTIIPANRSTRESVTNNDTFADFDQDYLTSSTDDDACCEEIIGGQTSEDDTSASSVTEVTKSTEKAESECQSSTPSPPTTLHRYFHVFRSGELEQLIEQNIQDLHVINSYYNERATSWCVVVEKVHVWTI